MTFQTVTGKMGNMRKAVEWVIYPLKDNDQKTRTIQSDKRIASVNLETGKAILSDGKGGHNGFIKLQPLLGAVEVDCPADLLEQIKSYTPNIGPVSILG